jgi:hypothetical protein
VLINFRGIGRKLLSELGVTLIDLSDPAEKLVFPVDFSDPLLDIVRNGNSAHHGR